MTLYDEVQKQVEGIKKNWWIVVLTSLQKG